MRYLPLCELVEISPTVRLEKGVEYPFVPMEDITPGRRYVQARQIRVASGGAKFGHGDTLFARITPCLENGKIAQFVSVPGQIAFGSTEYWVFRARPKISDPAFVFYLASADILRKPAEKSMAGASGRQRADIAAVKDIEVPAPSLAIQQRIASILSAYDDLIENNTRRIAVLEEMARRLYEEWFVRFHFPGHEQVRMVESDLGLIPEGWKISQLSSYGRVITGKTPSKTNADFFGHDVPFIKTPDMHGNMFCISTGESLSNLGAQSQASKTLLPNSLCVSCIGTAGVVTITSQCAQTNQQINSIVPSDPKAMEFLYFALCGLKETINQYGANGATMTNLNKTKFENLKVISSSKTILDQFHERVASMFDLVKTLQRKNTNLRAQRDLLLPKLISGEIDVSAFPEAEAVAA